MRNRRPRRALAAVCTASLVAAGVAAAARTPAPGRWTGSTSERGGVSFGVSSNRRQVTGFAAYLGYNGACGKGVGPRFPVHIAKMALSARHTFAGTTTVTAFRTTARISVRGSFVGARASGAITNAANRCAGVGRRSGRLAFAETFTARHA